MEPWGWCWIPIYADGAGRTGVFVVPGCEYSTGTGFEGHEYFEAASIRKKDDLYIFVYSSVVMHELCYAWSRSPLEGFQYGGVLNSNARYCELIPDKPAEVPAAHGADNHGSIVKLGEGTWVYFLPPAYQRNLVFQTGMRRKAAHSGRWFVWTGRTDFLRPERRTVKRRGASSLLYCVPSVYGSSGCICRRQ